MAGVRDVNELEGAVARPFQTGGGGFSLFLTPWEKAAALADSIMRRQPFVDANKRVALIGAGRLLDLYGLSLVAPDEEVFAAILELDTNVISQDEFAAWLEDRCVPVGPDASVNDV